MNADAKSGGCEQAVLLLGMDDGDDEISSRSETNTTTLVRRRSTTKEAPLSCLFFMVDGWMDGWMDTEGNGRGVQRPASSV